MTSVPCYASSMSQHSTNTAPLDTDVITRAAALVSEPDVWIQGNNDDGRGHYCAHGAVLRQACTPGDEHMWRRVMRKRGLGEEWNDAPGRTAAEVAERFAAIAAETTEADMAEVFGPQWEAIRDLVRRLAVLTPDDIDKLTAAWAAAWDAAARDAAWDAAGDAAGDAAWDAAWDAARAAAWDAAGAAAGAAARDAALDAALALVVRDLIGEQFTQSHYDTITAPLRSIGITVHPGDDPLHRCP
jgi:hypothetical protein